MKRCLILSLLVVFTAICSNGQAKKNDGLYLTGSIVGLNATAECSGAEGRILAQIELSMQFRNSSDRPIIVFKRDAFGSFLFLRGKVGKTQILLLQNLPSTADKISERIPVNDVDVDNCRPSNRDYYSGNYDPVADFIGRINLPTPSSALFEVIEPRGYYEFREVVTLDTGYDIDLKLGKSLKEARLRPGYPAFQIQYHLSLRSHAKGEGLLRDLQSKWKAIGDFALDGNGDFSVTSEPIINTGFN